MEYSTQLFTGRSPPSFDMLCALKNYVEKVEKVIFAYWSVKWERRYTLDGHEMFFFYPLIGLCAFFFRAATLPRISGNSVDIRFKKKLFLGVKFFTLSFSEY